MSFVFEIAVRGAGPGVDWRLDVFLGRFLSGHVGSARLGFYFYRAAQIIDFFFDQQTVAALRNALERERAEADTLEFFDGMLGGGENAAKNVFFRILQGDFVPEICGVAAGGVGLAHGADRRARVAAEAFQFTEHQFALNFDVVGLL